MGSVEPNIRLAGPNRPWNLQSRMGWGGAGHGVGRTAKGSPEPPTVRRSLPSGQRCRSAEPTTGSGDRPAYVDQRRQCAPRPALPHVPSRVLPLNPSFLRSPMSVLPLCVGPRCCLGARRTQQSEAATGIGPSSFSALPGTRASPPLPQDCGAGPLHSWIVLRSSARSGGWFEQHCCAG